MTWRVGALEMSPDSPVPLTNLVFWVKADQISGLSDGTALGTWQDQSGHSNDVTQATGANQPIYRSAVTALGGMPAVQFSGSQWLDRLHPVSKSNIHWSIFAVLQPTATRSQQVPVYNGRDTSGWGLANSTNTTHKGGLYGTVVWINSTVAADTIAEVWTLINDGSTHFYLDSVAKSTNTATPFTPTDIAGVENFSIGREDDTATTRTFSGYIAEVLIYSGVLNTTGDLNSTDQATVENYLLAKYGL